ncbi:hypothetical protein Patl1_32776 [Pistacia atlantica]|uniref:Uncharacterized protein n=1 Tax=Pistacia atlantica TaxID=434234 RepID=A0ACC1AMP8_9ROSI|nr:hypothetical protein Patl1_32776 [Pistacia atlantica]
MEAAAATTRSSSFAEVAGGTAGKCAAVCCCCPCGLVNLLVLAIYKVPAGLCKKALKEKQKKRLIKKGLLPPRKKNKCKCGSEDIELQVHPVQNFSEVIKSEEAEKEVMKLEKEMWERFYSTGFWRSTSQREALAEK